ncbi:gustatory receptor for sugar taste 64f-like [Uranotaenia lowii]|uniref:gustatory receptor for sugar taste 64f-like n=1 Tax=Uranotaenia lowii TaxID=190385 RepID=UPI0024795C65|nr:gustatory receptor for sugar taste 64f-like [Uranotaenia lowii]
MSLLIGGKPLSRPLATVYIILVSQFFGIFPVGNVLDPNPENFSFGKAHFCYWYAGVTIFGGYAVALLALIRFAALNQALDIFSIGEVVFFTYNATCSVIFWRIARKWKVLASAWYRTEEVFLTRLFNRQRLKWKIRTFGATMLILAIVEHCLSLGKHISNIYREAVYCNWTIADPVKHFAFKTYFSALHTFNYNVPVVFYNWFICVTMTYTWSFVDFFIILVSIGIQTRFSQLNSFIETQISRGRFADEQFWEQIRILYISLCELLDSMDTYMKKLIFFSFGHDLYGICAQIVKSFDMPYSDSKAYFLFSFIFILMRTLLMYWSCSRVYESSRDPCKLLLKVPSEKFNEEVSRIQMYAKRGVGFTGLGLFVVSRRILATIAGSILTYELVMITYRKKSDKYIPIPSCEERRPFVN